MSREVQTLLGEREMVWKFVARHAPGRHAASHKKVAARAGTQASAVSGLNLAAGGQAGRRAGSGENSSGRWCYSRVVD